MLNPPLRMTRTAARQNAIRQFAAPVEKHSPALQQQQEDGEEQVIAQLKARVAELELQLEGNLSI